MANNVDPGKTFWLYTFLSFGINELILSQFENRVPMKPIQRMMIFTQILFYCYCSWCCTVCQLLKVSPCIVIVQIIIFLVLWNHWTHSEWLWKWISTEASAMPCGNCTRTDSITQSAILISLTLWVLVPKGSFFRIYFILPHVSKDSFFRMYKILSQWAASSGSILLHIKLFSFWHFKD